jgi:2-keto-4-pentenoate hydratase
MNDDALLDYLEALTPRADVVDDILSQAPDLSVDDAYRLQFALMERRVARGDQIVGYKAAATTRAAASAVGASAMYLGTLLRSHRYRETEPITLDSTLPTFLESEITVVMGTALRGPGATAHDALVAAAGFLGSFEIAPVPTGALDGRLSVEHRIARHKTGGGFVFGMPMTQPAGIDLRVEGAVLDIDGEVEASATGVEVYGDPLEVVAEIANILARFDRFLAPGMSVMTGSIVPPVTIGPGVRDARLRFTRLGEVHVHFSPHDVGPTDG